MSVKKTQDPIIVTPPKPLPIPSPTYSLEEGEQGTSEAEVVTEPKARFVGSTHEEIPEWPGPYHITENGLYECAGYEFSTDLLVEVAPKGLTEITIEENGVYKPNDYDGYSKVTVSVQPILEELEVTENGEYLPTSPTQGFSKVTVLVEPPLVVDPVLENNSWEVIKAVCEAGEAANYWALGDTKNISVNIGGTPTNIPHAIVDFMASRYEYANDNTKHTNVVFQAVPTIGNYVFNPSSNTNANGAYATWYTSDLRTSMNSGALYQMYDAEFTALLEEVKTYEALDGTTDGNVVQYQADKLFLPAFQEVRNNPSNVLTQSAEKGLNIVEFGYYALNSDANSQRKKYPHNSASATSWWLRSPSVGYTYSECFVYSNGDVSNALAEDPYGVAPCFAF